MIYEQVINQKAEEEDWSRWHQWNELFLILQNKGLSFDVFQWRADLLDSNHNRKSFDTEEEALQYFEKRQKELDIIFRIQAGEEEVKKDYRLVSEAVRDDVGKLIKFQLINIEGKPLHQESSKGKYLPLKESILILYAVSKQRKRLDYNVNRKYQKKDSSALAKITGWKLSPEAFDIWQSIPQWKKSRVIETYLEGLAHLKCVPEITYFKKYGSGKKPVHASLSPTAKEYLAQLPSSIPAIEIIEDFLLNKLPRLIEHYGMELNNPQSVFDLDSKTMCEYLEAIQCLKPSRLSLE